MRFITLNYNMGVKITLLYWKSVYVYNIFNFEDADWSVDN